MSAGFEVVERADDARLADFASLTDVAARGRREVEHGIFVAEGAKIIRRAYDAGHRPRAILLSERWRSSVADIVASAGVAAYVAPEPVLRDVTGYTVHRGALAVFERPPPRDPDGLATVADRLVVLEDLTDHTNVGLVFRSAAALGMDGVLLAPRCADPLYRRAIKTSMGATLTLPYARLADWYTGIDTLRASGFEVVALTPDPGAPRLEDVLAAAGERIALLLGGEGDGLSERWQRVADQRARIGQREGIDSLNVAAAAAIACYLAGRDQVP